MTTQAKTAKAVLVSLRISQFTNRRHDRDATATVAADAGTNRLAEDLGRFNKALIDKSYLAEITTAIGSAQKVYRKYTESWVHGVRICPVKNLDPMLQELDKFRAEFEAAVNKLSTEWDVAVEEAKSRLGKYFDASQYPSQQDIADSFDFVVEVTPLPDPATLDDIRVHVGSARVKELQKAQEAELQLRWQTATRESARRLIEKIRVISENLSNPKGRTFDSLTGNVAELVEILPNMNLADDPEFDRLIAEAKEGLLAHSTEDLRENQDARAEVKAKADELLNKFSQF